MNALITLQGKALTTAIDAGLIHKAVSADGYDIKPFLDWWKSFEPILQKHIKEMNDLAVVLYKEGKYSPSNSSDSPVNNIDRVIMP